MNKLPTRDHVRPRFGRYRRLLSAIISISAIVVLSGCGQKDEAGIPDHALSLIPRSAPSGGGVISRSSAPSFNLKPDTEFCSLLTGYGLDGVAADEELEKYGQSSTFNGRRRLNGRVGTKGCVSGNPIFVRGFLAKNRAGNPYRAVLVLWQGQAAWAGAIERAEGSRPDVEIVPTSPTLFGNADRKRMVERSISLDFIELTRSAIKNVARNSGND